MLLLQGAQVLFLVRELRYCKPCGVAKKKKFCCSVYRMEELMSVIME